MEAVQSNLAKITVEPAAVTLANVEAGLGAWQKWQEHGAQDGISEAFVEELEVAKARLVAVLEFQMSETPAELLVAISPVLPLSL